MSQLEVCQTKRFFDTEFEATLYASRVEYHFNEPMRPYKCGQHWHITHADPTQSRGVGRAYWRCPKCKAIIKRSKVQRHNCAIKKWYEQRQG